MMNIDPKQPCIFALYIQSGCIYRINSLSFECIDMEYLFLRQYGPADDYLFYGIDIHLKRPDILEIKSAIRKTDRRIRKWSYRGTYRFSIKIQNHTSNVILSFKTTLFITVLIVAVELIICSRLTPYKKEQ